MNDFETMEWRDVIGYEGLYQVSENGYILSTVRKKHIILKPKLDKYGYLTINLYKNGIRKTHKIHRLVAAAFLEDFDESLCVNHKNELKYDNRVENLEVCTIDYNNNYGTRNDRSAEAHKKKVRCVELDMEFDSLLDAAAYVGASFQNISACLRGRQNKCAGYHWIYAN